MKIYIDESGQCIPNETKDNAIFCVAALVIPDEFEQKLFEEFTQWKLSSILQEKKAKHGEIKGSALDEEEIFSLLRLLLKYDVIVETVCMELGSTNKIELVEYQNVVADSFSQSNIGKKVNKDFASDVIKSLSSQDFMQLYSLIELINSILKVSLSYYAQRLPEELGVFDWFLDEKGHSFEKIFYVLVCPYLQNIHRGFGILDGEDYSAFDKFLIPPLDGSNAFEGKEAFNIGKIMDNLKFENSSQNLGLQIVDIIVNSIRRGMRGNLQFEGWKLLSALVVKRKNNSITIISLNPEKILVKPYTQFVNYVNVCGKSMLVPSHIKERVKSSRKGYLCWGSTEGVTSPDGLPIKKTVFEYY